MAGAGASLPLTFDRLPLIEFQLNPKGRNIMFFSKSSRFLLKKPEEVALLNFGSVEERDLRNSMFWWSPRQFLRSYHCPK